MGRVFNDRILSTTLLRTLLQFSLLLIVMMLISSSLRFDLLAEISVSIRQQSFTPEHLF